MPIAFESTYTKLPVLYYRKLHPTPVQAPHWIRLNLGLAEELGLDPALLSGSQGSAIFSGNEVVAGSEPLAMAYAGHQFGAWVPLLGDGRALLLGEVVTPKGERRDIQLKGSGPTPFSRAGDGRAALGPVLREYIMSEAMAALGIPTTRALAVVTTGESVLRERPLPGAIFTRVASSHLRIGTFQYAASQGDTQVLRDLADFTIARHWPQAQQSPHPYRALLQNVMEKQAHLVAAWMAVGFIHGVMNTDNTSLSGETIDYGPCAFMDTYRPLQVYSSIDRMGRYAFGRQPNIIHWNLTRFAETLLPLLAENQPDAIAYAQEALDGFSDLYNDTFLGVMKAKLGLFSEKAGDESLMKDLFSLMQDNETDFTLSFRRLSEVSWDGEDVVDPLDFMGLFSQDFEVRAWLERWRKRLSLQSASEKERKSLQRSVNPAFIARNHRVEQAIEAAYGQDFGPFERLLEALSRPFEDQPLHQNLMQPPAAHEVVHRTFCGT